MLLLHRSSPQGKEPPVFQHLIRDDRGQDLIEYVLLGSFIAIAAILGVTALGTNLNTWYSAIASWASKQSTKVP